MSGRTEVDEDLVAAVVDASRALVAIAAASIESAPQEVTLPQFRALVVLWSRGPARMSEVAGAARLSPSSTTRLVERLERKGLVRRSPSAESRRSTDLQLTTAGDQLVTAVMGTRRALVREVLARVPVDQRAAVADAFGRFAVAAGEPPTSSEGAVPGL